MFKSSPSLIAPKDVQPMVHTVSTLRVYWKITFYSKEIYCTRLNHSYKVFNFIVPHFSLVLFKGAVGKQLTKEYTLRKCTIRCTEGLLSGCTKIESLRTRWYVLSKTKACRIIIEVFHFYATCFILVFSLRKFLKIVGEILHLLTLYPKLIFRGALKKALMVLVDRSYQTQYFAKIFPSPLVSTLHIHFYLHFKESSENALLITIVLKSATFSASESAPKTALETTYFILFLKNLTKNLEKKLMIVFLLIE